MATLYWLGSQVTTRVVYRVTVTAAATGGTISATINSKTCTYTAVSSDNTTSVAANAVAAFQAFGTGEFRLMTWSSSGAVITATGPTDGRNVAITWAADGTNVTISGGGSAAIAATSPHDWNDGANFSGGSRPSANDTVIFSGNKPSVLYGLTADASRVVNILVRSDYRGSFGLPDRNSLGFTEFLQTRLQTRGTTLDIRSGGGGTFRIESTAVSAVTVRLTGRGAAEVLEVTGTPSSSTATVNGGGIVLSPYDGDSGTIATLTTSNGGWARCGVNLSLTTATFSNSSGQLDCGYTTLTIDEGGTVTTRLASAGTTTNVRDGRLNWGSTGSPGTFTVESKGFLDLSPCPAAPGGLSITAGTIMDNGRLYDPGKVSGGYNLTVKDIQKVKLDVGTNRTFTYS